MSEQKVAAEALARVLRQMEDSGHRINARVEIAVDDKLPFMGYTSGEWKNHKVVVSGFAVKSGMLDGLLAHELSHVYRNITNHPSHNYRLISEVMGPYLELDKAQFQQEALHAAVNHLQDLYADDIAIEVYTHGGKGADVATMREFFTDWVKDRMPEGDGAKARWARASLLLNNCFALSDMERHQIPDADGAARSKNERYLSNLGDNASQRFEYFHRFMVGLPEEIAEAKFKAGLRQYLEAFLDLVTAV